MNKDANFNYRLQPLFILRYGKLKIDDLHFEHAVLYFNVTINL